MIASSRKALSRLRRRLAERLGCDAYSWPALNGLDRRLDAVLGAAPGVFIEAGANDGYTQSNTYHLERFRGWRGLLIEPIPELCERCRRERPGSTVVQAALVGPGHAGGTIGMSFAGLMSVAENAFGDEAARKRHVESGVGCCGLAGSYEVRVPARRLSEIIDRELPGREIDLLSLDIEGGEAEALRGLDLERHRPRFILVEARDRELIGQGLARHYGSPAVLFDAGTYQDLLFQRRS